MEGDATILPPKFSDPDTTAKGERRAHVALKALDVLWFNTGTLCNITCENCYIESSPRNDRLVYLSRAEVASFLDQAETLDRQPSEIGLTGGEPFMNPDILGIIEDCLARGFNVLLLTNAMKPMQRLKVPLADLHRCFPRGLTLRVSLDHFAQESHEKLRGGGNWTPAIEGLQWLAAEGFDIAVAGRMVLGEGEPAMRAGYQDLFSRLRLPIDAADPGRLVLFPEMTDGNDVPEITESCWGILGKSPDSVMCATARMVVKRKGADRPVVVACTLLPYESAFEMGATLAEAAGAVKLNHRHCARFCVLGGASCGAHA